MKRHFRNTVILIALATLVYACTKRVNIPLQTGDEKLVVEGYLFGKDSVSWVRLTRSTAYFSHTAPPAVSHAQVTVAGKNKQWKFTESAVHPGWYFLNRPAFSPSAGDTFRLDIRLQEAVGGYKTYQSHTEIPPLRIRIDSIGIEYSPDFKKWMVRYYGQDLPGKDYYLFNSMVNGKIVSDSIEQKVIREDIFFDGRYVSGAVVQILNQDLLKAGNSYTLLASNITKPYYEYLRALQDEINEKNPLFSGPPANVTGNINHGALGFFTAFFTTGYRVKLKDIKSGQKPAILLRSK
jgi:hypothetical protein